MTKNTKMLIGVAVVAAAGYYLWSQSQKKSFANATSKVLANDCSGATGGTPNGETGMCCYAKSCTGGKCQCCRGGEAAGTKNMNCKGGTSGTLSTTERGMRAY